MRGFGLHSESEFERLNTALQLRVMAEVLELILIHRFQHIQLYALEIGREVGVRDMVEGCFAGGNGGIADGRALVGGRKECAGPVLYAAMAEGRADGDESRQVLVL